MDRAATGEVGKNAGMAAERKRRANGEESRLKIIEAATEIAGERGYEGTSISLVSERSGLPASSIYWHFADKDALLAAVIEHSYGRWLSNMGAWVPAADGADRREALIVAFRRTGRAIADAPDFLRLGLMLTLERRPDEPSARTLFLQVRRQSVEQLVQLYERMFEGELDAAAVRTLAMMAMAAVDGLFIAREVEGASVDMDAAFELIGVALDAVATQLIAQQGGAAPAP